jgi:hypothetical protein
VQPLGHDWAARGGQFGEQIVADSCGQPSMVPVQEWGGEMEEWKPDGWGAVTQRGGEVA